MNIKKFLDKVAAVILAGERILTGFTPYLSPKINAVVASGEARIADSLTLIGRVVADVQVAGISANLTNEQKLKAATPLVSKIIRESELFVGHSISDDKLDAYQKAIEGITSNFVDAINTLKTDNIQSA